MKQIIILIIGGLLIVNTVHIPSFSSNTYILNRDESCYTYDQLTELLITLQKEYPQIVSYESKGKTYEGRDIWLVKISDNVTIDEDEPEVLYYGGVHGDEKQGYQVIIYFLQSILENYSAQTGNKTYRDRIYNVIHNVELYFIPMVNPDGCEADTRKNARNNSCVLGDSLFKGVDINRNSGYKWELLDEHPFRFRRSGLPLIIEKINIKYPFMDYRSIQGEGCYRGPYPFSEPESIAIKSVVENHSISIAVDYHSFGSVILYPWGWTKEPPSDEALFRSLAENISSINGYDIKQSSDFIDILGLLDDWMYAEYGIYSICIELAPTVVDGPKDPRNNQPLSLVCKTHVPVNLYIAEQAISFSQE